MQRQVLKKNEQMYALLAITVALCPSAASALDDAVAGLLREKYSDKVSRMVRGDPASFDELFSYACPKFVAAAPPSLDGPAGNTSQDAYRTQLHLFLKARVWVLSRNPSFFPAWRRRSFAAPPPALSRRCCSRPGPPAPCRPCLLSI